MSGFYSYDAWKTTPPPDDSDDLSQCTKCGEWSELEDSQCPRCGYGEPPLYGCDSCNAMLPSDELSHVRNNSVGEGHFCAACLAPAYAAGKR